MVMIKKIQHWHLIAFWLGVFDCIAVGVSFWLGLWLRFDGQYSLIPQIYLEKYIQLMPIYMAGVLIIYWFFKLYRSIWRFASYAELNRLLWANVACAAYLFILALIGFRMPILCYAVGIVGQFGLTTAVRFSYRFILLERDKREAEHATDEKNVMVVGAGQAGQMIIRDMSKSNKISDKPVCIIDDNPNKWGRYIDSVPVVGGREDIEDAVKKYHIRKIYVAIPSISVQERKEIIDICKETGCELKSLPGVFQIINGEVDVKSLKNVEVEDLLGRDPITVDMAGIFRALTGKTIMVTGAGGSIGSELSRQIASHHPKQLILMDIYENSLHEIGLELKDKYPNLDLKTLVGSVRDSSRLEYIFSKYRPQMVYHAAAHKHVPLMEYSPNEAIKNNVIGTYKTAFAALHHGCERFVLISTDKAVNPTNIMGASKRLCEMVIQTFDKKVKDHTAGELPDIHLRLEEDKITRDSDENLKTEFVAVRFGNVLGSNGSVIPRFKEQIAKGGPVTVTHPDIIRYFMTIPEAVSLVLQAGTYARGGEIFVLDMGEPVKIDMLARNLIKLSGYKPDKDIKIEYTGLRPGEKLYEEKLMAEEGIEKTDNELIHIGKPIAFDSDEFIEQLRFLLETAYQEPENMEQIVAQIVTTYTPEQK